MKAAVRGFAAPAIVTLLGVAILIGFGSWQLERKAWKQDLIAQLRERTVASPQALPPAGQWNALSPATDEFRKVRFRADFLTAHRALIYTIGSRLRPDVSGPGHWVFEPARLDGGGLVFVNRGFVPLGHEGKLPTDGGSANEPVDAVGFLRWPEVRGWFAPQDDPARSRWYTRDHHAIAAAKGLTEVAPFYVDLESPVPPDGIPSPGPLAVNLPDNHLQYAVTWFGLALALATVFIFWAWAQAREGTGHGSSRPPRGDR